MRGTVGRVYLVGAGCGDAELITVRGLRLLQGCDAVVYDDLIDSELLAAVPTAAERIYMGKRSGRSSASQDEICAALVSLAREGKTVVRLKGGDPFIFGRGGEELLALRQAGIPCEEVPGISSFVAIPAAAGIPITYRGLSRSFHVITAHTAGREDCLPVDIDVLARLHGTLVFLMGLSKVEAICDRLIAGGMPPSTPAAVISGGNSITPAVVRATLSRLAEQTRAAQVRPPAVIVVGDVASLALTCTIPQPLRDCRVALTGTSAMTDQLSVLLRDRGAKTFCVERAILDELQPAFDFKTLRRSNRSWLVFTSANGVRMFIRHLRRQQIDFRSLSSCRIAVIGSATARALAEYGVYADLCPKHFTSEGLAQALLETAEPVERMYLFRSRRGTPLLYRLLSARFSVEEIPLYDLHSQLDGMEAARLKEADYLVFSSADGVARFFDIYGATPEGAVCVCIGEVTARALQGRCTTPLLIAREISAAGITDAIVQHWTRVDSCLCRNPAAPYEV